MAKYLFDYEETSVYANACKLIIQHKASDGVHLDIGCGNGAIAKSIEASGLHYIGIDINAESVAHVRRLGFEAYVIDLSEELHSIEFLKTVVKGRTVSSASLLDVVEHLPPSNRFLEELSQWFTQDHPKANLVTSIPNFAHPDICLRLFSGEWTYTETGLLDKTHLIVYTESSILSKLAESGWQCSGSLHYNLVKSDQLFIQPRTALQNHAGGIGRQLRGLKERIDKNSSVHQFLHIFQALEKRGIQPADPCRILIICAEVYDDFDRTKFCSFLKKTEIRYEIVSVIDFLRRLDPAKNSLHTPRPVYCMFVGDRAQLDSAWIPESLDAIDSEDVNLKLYLSSPSSDACIPMANASVGNLVLSPGPWTIIPTEILANSGLFSASKGLPDDDDWFRFLIACLVLCDYDRNIKQYSVPLESLNACFRTLNACIDDPSSIEEAVNNLWNHSQELQEWLTLPSRLESIKLTNLIDHRDNDITEFKSEIARRDNDITEFKSEVARRDNDITEFKSEVARRDNDITTLNTEITNRDGEISALNNALTKQVKSIDELQTELAKISFSLQAAVNLSESQVRALTDIKQSLSWRITKPLRLIRRLIG